MKNFLIVKLSAIGDVIHALPVAYALKETYPDSHLTWVVEPPAYDLVKMCPYIDEVILFEKKKFKSLRGFLREYGPLKRKIQARSYDAVLDLQGLFKSAAIARLGKAPVKLGMCNMRELSDRISRPVIGPHASGHIVERYLDVARALGCRVEEVRLTLEVPQREADLARRIFAQAGASMDNAYAVFAIGANWPNKRWPAKYFAQLADKLYDRQIVHIAAAKLGINDLSEEELLQMENQVKPLSMSFIPFHSFGTHMGSSSQEMFMSESAAIRKLAEDAPCIFLGRSADYALRKKDNVFSIFVCADDDFREARGKAVYDGKSLKELDKEDEKRARYYNYYTGRTWGAGENYDLVVNTSSGELEKIADGLIAYMRTIKG